MPSPSASGRSPLVVSSAIAVVITRVTPSMLPPTIITAPTSAIARPNAGEHDRHQREAQVVQQRQRRGQPARRRASATARAYSRQASATACRESAAMSGEHQDRLRDDHRRRGEQDAERAERPGARQQQVDARPTTTGGSPSSALTHDDERLLPGNRATASAAPNGSASSVATAIDAAGSRAATARRSRRASRRARPIIDAAPRRMRGRTCSSVGGDRHMGGGVTTGAPGRRRAHRVRV